MAATICRAAGKQLNLIYSTQILHYQCINAPTALKAFALIEIKGT